VSSTAIERGHPIVVALSEMPAEVARVGMGIHHFVVPEGHMIQAKDVSPFMCRDGLQVIICAVVAGRR
jgi:hypothetical protein